MKRFLFISGLAIGFVIGSRMGRGPYESLERTARQIVEDPEVQRKAAQARDTAEKVAQDATETVKDKAPGLAENAKEKATGLANAAKDRVSGDKQDETELTETSQSTATAAGDVEVGEDKPLSS